MITRCPWSKGKGERLLLLAHCLLHIKSEIPAQGTVPLTVGTQWTGLTTSANLIKTTPHGSVTLVTVGLAKLTVEITQRSIPQWSGRLKTLNSLRTCGLATKQI